MTDLRLPNSIYTNRLHLQIVTTEDYAFMMALVNSKGWLENIGDRNVHSKEDAISYINKILATENFFYWVVRTNDTNTPVGIVSFLKRSYLPHFDIGFAFLPEHSGVGYAYEAAKAVLDMALQQPAFNAILATTVPSNVRSIKLLMKLGLRFGKEIENNGEKLHVYTTE